MERKIKRTKMRMKNNKKRTRQNKFPISKKLTQRKMFLILTMSKLSLLQGKLVADSWKRKTLSNSWKKPSKSSLKEATKIHLPQVAVDPQSHPPLLEGVRANQVTLKKLVKFPKKMILRKKIKSPSLQKDQICRVRANLRRWSRLIRLSAKNQNKNRWKKFEKKTLPLSRMNPEKKLKLRSKAMTKIRQSKRR